MNKKNVSMVCTCTVAMPVRFLAFFSGFTKQYPQVGQGIKNYVFRIVTVILILIICAVTPSLSALLNVIGSLESPTLKFTLPPLYYKVKYNIFSFKIIFLKIKDYRKR